MRCWYLSRYYKEHLSGYDDWEQKVHAGECAYNLFKWTLMPYFTTVPSITPT